MTSHHRWKRWLESRSGWGWVGAYLVVAWGALQFADTIDSLIGLPAWSGRVLFVLLLLGLLAVLLMAVLQHHRTRADTDHSRLTGRLPRALTGRRLVVAGVVAFSFLGLGTAGHLTSRVLGIGPAGTLVARGVLADDGELVLANFDDYTGAPDLARALTQAFRIHLSQSPTIRLASEARVTDARARMQAESGAPLDLEMAREIAIREGIKAVVAGEIHRVGSRYALSLRLVAAESGQELIAGLEHARRPDDLIPAVERLSLWLRERIGESLASVRHSPPLSRVRTASLAALKSYTEAADANGRGDFERCALLMEEAIALDSAFAMAYVGRAACNQNMGRNPALQVADRIHAYSRRDRMTDEERLRFTATYHQFVKRDRRQAIEAWEAYFARYPDRTSALFALANLYAETREPARAEATLNQALARDSSNLVVLVNLAGYQTSQGRFADAELTLARLARELPNLDVGWWRATLRLAQADWVSASAELTAIRERARGDPGRRARVAALQSMFAQTLGRIDEAEQYLREAIHADLEAGAIQFYHLRMLTLAELYLMSRADTARALALADSALALHPVETLEPFARSYETFAEILARCGRIGRARVHLDAWEREVAPLLPGSSISHELRATLAEVEGRWHAAIAEWRLADERKEDPLPALVHIGGAHDRLARPDSAIVYYRRYLETPSRLRYNTDATWRGPVLERLAQLHEARGEHEDAVRFYDMLGELWQGADPFLQPRVEAARRRLEVLVGDRRR
jgi:tetratricopeptide (TPR) repeat protein